MAIFNCYIKLPAGKPLSSCTLGTSSAPSLGSRSPAFSSSPAKAGKCSSEARREQKRAPREEPGARIGDLCCLIRWLGIVPWRLWKVKDEVWNQILGDFFPWQVMKDDEFWHWILVTFWILSIPFWKRFASFRGCLAWVKWLIPSIWMVLCSQWQI